MAGELYEMAYPESSKGPPGQAKFNRPPDIPYERRLELLRLAEQITRTVHAQTEPGPERCLLRRMVETLVE